MEAFVERVGVQIATTLLYPLVAWAGRGIAGGVGVRGGLALGAIGYASLVVVVIQPEKALDFLLGTVATTAEVSSQLLSVAANKIRVVEKQDLEKLLNEQIKFLEPLLGDEKVPETPPQQAQGPLLLGQLLPKDYEQDNFPYYLPNPPLSAVSSINNEYVDDFIRAYHTLNIDIVKMVLGVHQLPQMQLVKAIYRTEIKKFHPDKDNNRNSPFALQRAIDLNLAYAKIRNMMKSPEQQAQIMTPILQYYHKGAFSPNPYLILFAVGGVLILLLR